MQKCLGIYIENNLIKYAKVSKDNNDMKIESFGIRFYQNLSEEIKKIIQETYSFNTPISINLSNEKYLYFDIFALLSKKDVEKTVDTEFENFCDEKKYNKEAFETRYALMPSQEDREKIRALDIYINKIEYNRQINPLEKYKLTKVMPVSIAIGNVARLNKNENVLIINMEETTTVTTIYNKQIYDVETIEIGSKNVLDNINKVENSYAKAYDICKNTTIYTANVGDIGEEQPYLQHIMPTVFKITEKVQEIVSNSVNKIQEIYLTGTLASINNIDLYFQEMFTDIDCKILKPKMVDETVTKINIKDYIEVNSAIALATVGLGEGIQELNFRKVKPTDKIFDIFKRETSKTPKKETTSKINFNLKGALSKGELWMIRAIAGILLFLMVFCIFTKVLSNQMLNKEKEIDGLIEKQKNQISTVTNNASTLDGKTQKYERLTSDVKKMYEKISDKAARRNSIPNLLNQIMANIPDKVDLDQIENTKDRTIVINAKAGYYDQLGYFVAVLKTKNILKNVITSSTKKPDGTVYISIEGELP